MKHFVAVLRTIFKHDYFSEILNLKSLFSSQNNFVYIMEIKRLKQIIADHKM
jgi:hypothetical protein